MKKKILYLIVCSLISLALGACSALDGAGNDTGLTAFGTIATDHIRVAPEIGGKVLEINVAEGERVQAGDVLFSLDDEILQGQARQAQAAVDLARVSVEAAKAQLASAQMQYELTLQQTRLGEIPGRASAWITSSLPSASDLPVWYFEKSELLAAAQAEVNAADQNLTAELANLAQELEDASNGDFVAVENRLVQAQMTFLAADQTLLRARSSGSELLEDAAQEQVDAAQAELDAAELEYDRMLSTSAAQAVLEARARAAVARARLDTARDTLTGLQTGEQSLQAQAALSGVTQAEKAVLQAEANLVQAQAAQDMINLQLKRCLVTAPTGGTVLSLDLETGELLAAGSVALTIGQLDEVNLTVYVPEDRYGKIVIGQNVSITVDSFPGKTFTGQVQAIAEEAEFTPRNVQTVDGRKSTVFAVKIQVPNPGQELKPGMPADVDFMIK